MRLGIHFNLDRELKLIQATYFPDVQATIRWGKNSAPRKTKHRSMRMGSWDEAKRLIRIHPALDREWVPLEYLHYLIYHELCHAVERPRFSPAGNQIHHEEFHALENQYPEINRMRKLGREIFERLIAEGL